MNLNVTMIAPAAVVLLLVTGSFANADDPQVAASLTTETPLQTTMLPAPVTPKLQAPEPASPPQPADDGLTAEQRLRREKLDYLWRTLYPWSYAPELVDFFCGEHERAGLGEMWWQSFVYGASGSEMRPSMICIGGGMVARGLMDCAWTFARSHRGQLEPLLSGSHPWGPDALFDPWVSIRCHVLELRTYQAKTGREDWSLLRKVFLPVSPDGARTQREQRRWQRIEKTHLKALNRAYASGKLPLQARLAEAR